MRSMLAAGLLAFAHSAGPAATAGDAGQTDTDDRSAGFPVALGGPFRLTDDTGAPRHEAAPGADIQLLFFGYANCAQICSAALPLMGQAVHNLAETGIAALPVMITVDPERDRVGTMGATLRAHHADFVGLTGTEAELASVRVLFGVERQVLFHDPGGQPVYAHGSHIYVLDGQGAFLTLLPPVLSPERLADIVAGYAG